MINDQEIARLEEMLRKKASKAFDARIIFDRALENMKERKTVWAAMCEKYGINPECDPGDWMC